MSESVVLLADLVQAQGDAEGLDRYTVAATAQEVVLVHDGERADVGLLLEDGRVVMLPWAALGPLAKFIDGWRRMLTHERPLAEGMPYAKELGRR